MTNTSKFIARILRHHPESIGIQLDEHGWARVDELITGIAKTQSFDMAMLEEIVQTDSKKRYSFSDDKTRIRANQGHSIPVDVELEQKMPPDILWHGTGEKYVGSINKIGLVPKSRLYVHLSGDRDTAQAVGSRHGKPVIYQVDAGSHTENIHVHIVINSLRIAEVPMLPHMDSALLQIRRVRRAKRHAPST